MRFDKEDADPDLENWPERTHSLLAPDPNLLPADSSIGCCSFINSQPQQSKCLLSTRCLVQFKENMAADFGAPSCRQQQLDAMVSGHDHGLFVPGTMLMLSLA